MLLGLEQFLALADQNSDPLSDDPLTESDSPVHNDSKSHIWRQSPPHAAHGLRSLLSGNQNAPKKRVRRRPALERPLLENTHASAPARPDFGSSKSSLASEMSPSLSSLSHVSLLPLPAPLALVSDLERRVFSTMRGVSASDYLKQSRLQKADAELAKTENATDSFEAEFPQELELVSHQSVSVTSAPQQIPPEIDPALFGGTPVAAKDLFASFAPKKTKNKLGQWQLKVRLKISPRRLAEIKKYENPLNEKGSAGSGPSLMAALMHRKIRFTYIVTLKLPSAALAEIHKTTNPLYTKSSGHSSAKSASSVFAMMMKSATVAPPLKYAAIQKLKGLEPPAIPRAHLHVTGEAHEPIFPMPRKSVVWPSIDLADESMRSLMPEKTAVEAQPAIKMSSFSPTSEDLVTLIKRRAPSANEYPYKRIIDDFMDGDDFINGSKNTSQNWPQLFQPLCVDHLLLHKDTRRFIDRWINNAFAILKSQSTRTPRNVKIREIQKRRKREMADFVMDDELTDEEVFLPILIIVGESGSCKSAAVYAAMDSIDGYVHEINTGQQRAKKDIYSSLKEFCTTQIIHQNNDEFQKGVVLFEDCDILFEQDKSFWSIVQDVINFSRRPIVVTVTDPAVIPRNIWDAADEQGSILTLFSETRTLLHQYLWLCALSQGFDVSDAILDDLSYKTRNKEGFDVRKALMALQWLCYLDKKPHTFLRLELPEEDSKQDEQDLAAKAAMIEALSASDVMETKTQSSILHDVQQNELLDVYVIDESRHIRQKTLPYELNIGRYKREWLQKLLVALAPEKGFSFNAIRSFVHNFVASRAKKIPKFLQELNFRTQTRLRSSEDFQEEPDVQGLPETSIFYSTPASTYITQLAPIARYWARFQSTITAMDEERESSIELYLGWRRFHGHEDEVIATLGTTHFS